MKLGPGQLIVTSVNKFCKEFVRISKRGLDLYASFLKGQGHQGIFSLGKGHPLRKL